MKLPSPLRVAKFIAVFLGCTALFTVLWSQWVADRLYHCTDPGWLDYLFPGQWVHHPVSVDQVVAGSSMSESDTIKAGWSIASLWGLWGSKGKA